jgi:REP element-mobilizing transposase RayT
MSYVQIFIHAVVRTYKSEHTLPTNEQRESLYRIMHGIIENKGSRLYRINSMSDHVHLLFTLPPTTRTS